jgi:signal transduction histidine kinase
MRERSFLVGGKLTVESSPGGGTTVFVQVPLIQAPAVAHA